MCCGSDPIPNTFPSQTSPDLITAIRGNLADRSVEDLRQRQQEIEANPLYNDCVNLSDIDPQYKDAFSAGQIAKHVVVVALVIIGFTTFILFALGHLQTFPQDFLHWVQHINPVNAALGGGIAFILVAGASWVIYRAQSKMDVLLDDLRGTFGSMDEHLESAIASYQTPKGHIQRLAVYIDKSTLDQNGDGKAFLYYIKDPSDHYFVSAAVTLLSPAYLAGSMGYNTIRAVAIPFYVLAQYAREKCTGRPVAENERFFKLSDAPKEMIKSIVRVVKAPFYALAFFMAGLYSLVNPMGGRKLGASIERDWNEEVSLPEGYWSMGGAQ